MKKILYIFIIGLVGFSCTDLDEDVYDKIPGELYPENADQVANLSVEAYAQLKPFADDEGWWFLAQEISSDEFCAPTRGSDWFDGGKWLNVHRHEWSNDDESVNRMWEKFWNAITSCNQSLDMMRMIPPSDQINGKIAEVEVLRSFYYYLLIDNFGDVPYLTSAADAPAKPLRITREAIWDSIVDVTQRNLPMLKDINNKYMATRYMGLSLLAKLYLNAEVYTGTPQWETAGLYCDSVMMGPYSNETNVSATFVTENSSSSEIIFSIPYDEDNFQGFRLHMRTLHYQSNLTYDMPVGPWNGLCVTPNHFDTYEDSDIRKAAWFIYGIQYASDGSVIFDGVTNDTLDIDPYLPALQMTAGDYTPDQIRNTGARVGKYEIAKGAKENLSNDFPLFRITDIQLMKAETEIRINGSGSGDEWINPIRQRAGVSTWSGASLDDLLAERGRELFCEGHRRQDLIRFGKFTESWWAKGDAQGGVANDESVEIFPIPKWATDANSNLLLDAQ